MELKDLIGKHFLSGVDRGTRSVKAEYNSEYEDCDSIAFTLDKITYLAIENPDDGYRSSCREIEITKEKLKNTFKPVEVFCVHVNHQNFDKADILQILNMKTAKIILEVGTENINNFYPGFVASWSPENL